MASFLDADGIKALLPMPGTKTNPITMTSAAQVLTPAPAQLQPSTQLPSDPVTYYQPTTAPTSSLPTRLQYPTTLVAFVHEGAWAQGKTRLLTMRGNNAALQGATNRNLGQVFTVDSEGRIRSASGTGPYMAPSASCDAVAASNTPASWSFVETSTGAYDVQAVCGGNLKRMTQIDPGFDMTGSMEGLIGMTSNSASGWFIVPVART
jgi:hypothetical protein